METKIRAKRTGGSGQAVDLKSSLDGDLRVAQYLPPYAMLCAAGKVFSIDMTNGSPVGVDITVPTTAPEWAIYNNNPSGSNHLVLLEVACINATGTTGLGLALLGTVGVGAQSAVVTNYGNTVISCLDGTSKQPNLFLDDTPSIQGTQPSWVVLAASDQSAAITVGAGLVAHVDGMIIVPPGNALFLVIVGIAGSSAFDVTIVIAELMLDTA